jgi:uncharacterized membrane protein YfcA
MLVLPIIELCCKFMQPNPNCMNQFAQTRVSPFTTVIFKVLGYVEVVALAGAAVGFAMLYISMEGALEILTVALSVLAGVYFLRDYNPRPMPEQKGDEPKAGFFELLGGTIVPKVGWIACSVTTVGILFRLLGLKGNEEMLMIGCTTLTVVLFLLGIFIVSKADRATGLMPLVYRALPLWLVGVYLFMNKPG